MSKIRANVGYSERRNQFYYKEFTVVKELPDVIDLDSLIADDKKLNEVYKNVCVDIEEVSLDPEQPRNEVYNYDYYKLQYFDAEYYLDDKKRNDEDGDETLVIDYLENRYVCIERKYDESEEE